MMPWSQMKEADDTDPVLSCTSDCVMVDDYMPCPLQQHHSRDIDAPECPSLPPESHDIYPEEAASGAIRKRPSAVMFGAVLGQATAFMLIFTAFKTMSHLLVSTVKRS